jgi:drug/metabolite transporter (DMT)-like permease
VDVASPEAPATTKASSAPSHARLYSLLVLMVALWSLNFVIGKIALREFPPLLLAAVRTAIAGIVIIPVFLLRNRRRSIRWTARDIASLLVLGVLGIALNQVFFVMGLSHTSVAHSAIVIAMMPVLVLLMAAIRGQETLTWRKVSGLAVAISGAVVLQAARHGGEASIVGDIYTLLCGVVFAAYTVFGKSVLTKYDTVTMNTFAYVGGALALTPVILWSLGRFNFTSVSPAAWLSVGYMAIFSSVISYLIYSYALSHIAASRVSAFSYLQPLGATLLAIPILGEHVTAPLLIGGALTLAGVYTTERA